MNIKDQPVDKLLYFIRIMTLIRKFEEGIDNLFGKGKIFGTSHLCVGQEGVAVGACYPLQQGDLVASTHRGHGHAIARGVDLKKLSAELLGKKEGLCGGRGGTQHLSDLDAGFLGTNGITGGFIPVAVGAALGFKMRKKDNAVISFFGDGASNTGYFHESLNFASIYKLPVIFICENNFYAMSVPVQKSTAVKDIALRSQSYSMPGLIVDGNDPIAVENVVKKALERARGGEGPTLIEAKTYRFYGHSKSDMRVYRTREEENFWKSRDPLVTLPQRMLEEGTAKKEEIDEVCLNAEKEIKEALDWALSLPDPTSEDIYQGLFTE